MNDINLCLKKVGDIEGEFFVPAYQRGYRWDEEVVMLLRDINELEKSKNYCLQPIVVKKTDDELFELIDGQQRLTTIHLIYRYLRRFFPESNVRFSISYETRIDSRKFIDSVDFDNLDVEIKNIDEYYIIEAAKKIVEWFNRKVEDGQTINKTQTAINLITKLNENINVIWYEVSSDENSAKLFTRLNIGRIPLTNSELVRALFLSRDNGIDDYKQLEIAQQWDIIERELHRSSFWFFITNVEPEIYPTRIELIFDLMAHKEKGNRDKFYTFYHFCDMVTCSGDKSEIWYDIQRYYQRLKEWYENRKLYHKVGYLIASGSKSMRELIDSSENATKKEFKSSLNGYIAESIKYEKDYCDLTYESKRDYSDIENLLLLFNVETIDQKDDETRRFPFDKHKQEKWSLEHIHAQQSEGMNKKEQWVEWLKLHMKSLVEFDKISNMELIEEIAIAIDDDKLRGETFSALYDKVSVVLSENINMEYIHSLSNMALLAQSGNSALSNSLFDVKRNRILDMDKNGDYIPECTRRVFLKYYTPSEKNQMFFWSNDDRAGYLDAIGKVLGNYLTIIGKEIGCGECDEN